METSTKNPSDKAAITNRHKFTLLNLSTIANRITFARLILSVFYFALLSFPLAQEYDVAKLDIAVTIYLIVCVGDILDGYFARLYNEETTFGRVMDPLVDKLVICGSFVYLIQISPINDYLFAWMVVIVLAREFLVQTIRVNIESAGIPFGANPAGKTKTFLQNTVIVASLIYAAHYRTSEFVHGAYVPIILTNCIMLAVTVGSGVIYAIKAYQIWQTR